MTQLTLADKTFAIVPTIGHCLKLKAIGVDLIGDDSALDLQKLVASPVDFVRVLEILIADQVNGDDSFVGDALAGLLDGERWTKARIAVLQGFKDFFRAGGKPDTAAALDALQTTADEVTAKVATSLESGELRQKIDQVVAESLEELKTIDIGV